MARPLANNFSNVDNLGLTDSLGVQFTGQTSDPADSDLAAGRLYYNSTSGVLKWYNGTSWTNIGASTASTPTWESIFTGDNTLAITAGTWTISQSSANAILTLNKTNAGAGAIIAITNSGTGNDITGNAGNWSVTAAGLASFATNSVMGGTLKIGSGAADAVLQSNGNNDLTIQTGNATSMTLVLTNGANGDITATMNGTGKVNITGTTAANDSLKLTQGDLQIAAGRARVTNTSNTVANVLVTNNSATTYGIGGASTGLFQIVSTSLTSGTMLNLQVTEGTFTSGNYIRCWDATGGSATFTVARYGATTIGGNAAGTAALTLTAGDAVVSSGSLLITRASNNATALITNNTATSTSLLSVVGSGVFTGSGATAFMGLIPSGLTTGTALDITAAGLTTGKAIALTTAGLTTGNLIVGTANAMTTGVLISLSSTSNVLTSGSFLTATWNPALVTSIASGALISIVDSPTINATVASTMNDLKIVRTNTTAAAAITFTPSGSVFYLENAAPTVGAGSTLTDTAEVLTVKQSNTAASTGIVASFLQSAGAGSMNAVTVTANSVTTSSGVVTITANGLTTGTALNVTSSGTNTGTGLVKITGSGLTTGVGLLVALNSLTSGQGVSVSTTGQTTGSSVLVTGGGANLLAGGKVIEVAMGAATAGNGLTILTSGVYAGTGVLLLTMNGLTTGLGVSIAHTTSVIANGGALLSLTSSGVNTATTSGCLVNLANSGSLTGTQILFTDTAITTGVVMKLTHTAGVIASGGSMLRVGTTTVDTSTTTGVLLDLTATAATTGNLCMLTSATLTTGQGFDMVLNGLTTGAGLRISSSSTDTGARGLIQLTQTGAAATGVSMLRMNQVVTSTNFRKIFTESNTGITLWWGNGTTGNANLAATTGDVLLNGGSNKPEYCTNGAGSLWSPLV